MTEEWTDVNWEDELCRANTGAIRFLVQSVSGSAQLSLCDITPPYDVIFRITIADMTRIIDVVHKDNLGNHEGSVAVTEFNDLSVRFHEFWLSWFNEEVCMGLGDSSQPFITYKHIGKKTEMIGCVRFAKTMGSNHLVNWIYEAPPMTQPPKTGLIPSDSILYKNVNDGELRWVNMTDHKLPPDALIGGFEKEAIYIARAEHNGSLCPGKYVPSQRLAYIPWGGREHSKTNFQILCGFNVAWVPTKGNKIPQNAFIGGYSEVRRGPLYIGRAVHDGNLISGKIHVIYHTCYLPYKEKEVEVYSFDILVQPDISQRSVLSDYESEI